MELKKNKNIGKAHFSLERVPSSKSEVAQIYKRIVRGLPSTLQLNSRWKQRKLCSSFSRYGAHAHNNLIITLRGYSCAIHCL